MKTLKFILGAILVFGLQQRLPAPQSFDTIFTLDELPPLVPPPSLTVDITNNGGSYSGEITDWYIPTPDGTLTPGNSTLGSATFMLSPTEIPLDNLVFDGPGGSYGVNLDPGPGSISDPTGDTINGTWQVPDDSNAFLTLGLAAAVVIGFNVVSRKRGRI